MTLTIRQAIHTDIPELVRLHDETSAWLRGKGLDQWQFPARIERYRHSILTGTCHLLIEDDATKGTITVDGFADPDFWTPADNPDDALYIHRMIVARAAAGHGLGSILLDYGATLASRAGRHYIRLDAWRTNQGLVDYYKRHGFTHVRTVEAPHRQSGALFERAVSTA